MGGSVVRESEGALLLSASGSVPDKLELRQEYALVHG